MFQFVFANLIEKATRVALFCNLSRNPDKFHRKVVQVVAARMAALPEPKGTEAVQQLAALQEPKGTEDVQQLPGLLPGMARVGAGSDRGVERRSLVWLAPTRKPDFYAERPAVRFKAAVERYVGINQ